MPKQITNLAPLLGRMSALFMARQCICHSSPLSPTTVLLWGAVPPLPPPQLLWRHRCNRSLQKPARMKQGRDPKNNGDTGKRKGWGLPKKGKKSYWNQEITKEALKKNPHRSSNRVLSHSKFLSDLGISLKLVAKFCLFFIGLFMPIRTRSFRFMACNYTTGFRVEENWFWNSVKR